MLVNNSVFYYKTVNSLIYHYAKFEIDDEGSNIGSCMEKPETNVSGAGNRNMARKLPARNRDGEFEGLFFPIVSGLGSGN